MTTIILAKWVSAGCKHWVELRKHVYHDGRLDSYSYRCDNGCSRLVTVNPVNMVESAIRVIQARVDLGRFVPDGAVTPMERIV
jgi:hypothetical protein